MTTNARKVALITGASSGIGQSTAVLLAEKGMDIVINYNQNKVGAEKTEDLVKGAGVRSLIVQADVTKKEQVNQMVNMAVDEFGKIDVSKQCWFSNKKK